MAAGSCRLVYTPGPPERSKRCGSTVCLQIGAGEPQHLKWRRIVNLSGKHKFIAVKPTFLDVTALVKYIKITLKQVVVGGSISVCIKISMAKDVSCHGNFPSLHLQQKLVFFLGHTRTCMQFISDLCVFFIPHACCSSHSQSAFWVFIQISSGRNARTPGLSQSHSGPQRRCHCHWCFWWVPAGSVFAPNTSRFCNLGFYLFIFQFFDFHLTLGSKLTGHFTALDNTRKVPGDNLLNRPTVKAHLRHRSPVAKWSACGLCQELCPEMVRKYLRFHNQSFITANHSRQGHIVLTNHKCNNGLQCLQCGSINCVVKHRWVTTDDFLCCLKEVKATKKLHFKLGNKCY